MLAGIQLDRLWCSPLQRAVQTADAIGRRAEIKPIRDAAFLDRDYGEFNERPAAEVTQRFATFDDAPEVEPRAEFFARVVAGIERVLAASADPVMIVAHDAVNRAILAMLAEADDPDLPQPTGSWNALRLIGLRWVPRVLGARPGDGRTPTLMP